MDFRYEDLFSAKSAKTMMMSILWTSLIAWLTEQVSRKKINLNAVSTFAWFVDVDVDETDE